MREWPFNSRCCRHGDGGPLMPSHPPAPVAVITCFYLIIFHVFTISAHMCKKQHKDVFSPLLLSLFSFARFATENVTFGRALRFCFFSFFDLRVRAP